MKVLEKSTSRKFWLAVAAFLASLAAGVTGVADPSVCAVCMAVSAGIYAACEAYVDGQAAKSTQTISTTSVTATSTSQKVVEKALAPETQKEGE